MRDVSNLLEILEQVKIQNPFAVHAIETFDIRVLIWLTGLRQRIRDVRQGLPTDCSM